MNSNMIHIEIYMEFDIEIHVQNPHGFVQEDPLKALGCILANGRCDLTGATCHQVFNILGEGCFGQVWKCEALDLCGVRGPTIVAVKTLKENATERERLDLAQELKVFKSLEPHPNVVRLLGCCTEREPTFVILEYVSGGKLQSFLRASREERNQGGPGLTSRDLTSFGYQVRSRWINYTILLVGYTLFYMVIMHCSILKE